jgi:hypothetical protein
LRFAFGIFVHEPGSGAAELGVKMFCDGRSSIRGAARSVEASRQRLYNRVRIPVVEKRNGAATQEVSVLDRRHDPMQGRSPVIVHPSCCEVTEG